jgi:hypothetical protein
MRVMLSAVLLATAARATAAGPATTAPALPPEVYLLPQDSVVVVGADLHGFFASRLWAQVSSGQLGAAAGLSAEKSAEIAREAQQGMTKGMAEMEAEVGFRADRDVDWVFFGLRNPDAPSPEGVAVVLGRFDAARILASAEASQKKNGSTVTRKQVGAVTVLSTAKAGKPGITMAVAGPRHLFVGDAPLVEAALAAHAAGRRPLQANTAMVARLRGVKPAAGIFLLAGEALMQKMGQGGAPPPVPLPKTASLSLEFDGATELAAEMASAADAQQAATAIQGQLGMISALMAQDKDPQKAVAGKMMGGLTVSADGPTLRVAAPAGELGLGTVMAMAVPSLLKARLAANESAAIGDLRSLTSGQAAYQSANEGLYGDLPCLSEPKTCLKGYTGPQFLDAQLTSLELKNGYRRAFHPGKRAARARSLQGYAYTAVPAEPGTTGLRSFCVESSGVIRVDPRGGDIKPVGGACPATLETLK